MPVLKVIPLNRTLQIFFQICCLSRLCCCRCPSTSPIPPPTFGGVEQGGQGQAEGKIGGGRREGNSCTSCHTGGPTRKVGFFENIITFCSEKIFEKSFF